MTTRYVLAVDPGKATGVALFGWTKGEEPVLLASWEVVLETYPVVVRDVLSKYPTVEFVCEKFTITTETGKKSQAPFSLEMIGITRLLLLDAGRDPWNLPLQTPTDAKKIFTNPKIKKMGYWHRGGEGHALDAIRHGLLYLSRAGWPPRGLLSS